MISFNIPASASFTSYCFYGRYCLANAHRDNKFSLGITGGVVSALWRGRPPKLEIRHLTADVCHEVIPCPIEFTPKARSLTEYSMIISIDTEYFQSSTAINIDGKSVLANTILSYQYSAVFIDGKGNVFYAEGIIKPTPGQRISYKSLLLIILRRFGIGYRRAANMKILSIAHFGVAEWSAYSDRADYLDKLSAVRKVPVTLGTSLEISLPFGNGHSATVSVTWRDSILLAPGSGSLHSVSKVTHHKKVELPDKWIEKMDVFLENYPVEFDRYAIADARVALEFYLKTILQFEQLTGVSKAPLTLGDAAVKTYVKWCEDNGLTTDDIIGRELVQVAGKFGKLKTELHYKPVRSFSEAMAAGAYMGGMNIAFESGINKEPGYIILDVDFSGAYAAAMAVVARIDWDIPSKPVSLNEIKQLYRNQKALSITVPIVFCHLKFAFPENSRHACLPMPSPYGLLEVLPVISASGNLVKSVFEKENGLEEAVFRRADHWFFAAGRGRRGDQGTVSAAWLQ